MLFVQTLSSRDARMKKKDENMLDGTNQVKSLLMLHTAC
jgi:hypothetical protein